MFSTTFKIAVNAIKISLTPNSVLINERQKLWESATLRIEHINEIDTVLSRLLPGRLRYENVASAIGGGITWWYILMLHAMEAGGKQHPFNFHLHCGDPLPARTFHVPAGRPKANPHGGTMPPSPANPYSWEESAIDALLLAGDDKERNWSIGAILLREELFNGKGYMRRKVPSPYLWSFTSVYTKGKYIADGVYDPNFVSQQPGCAAYILRLKEQGIINI